MGMFGKKDRKVPDLTRYDSYYENQSRSNSLTSQAAAATALRTYSLNSQQNNYKQYYQQQPSSSRANSLRNNSIRNNSIRNNSIRNNSLRNNSIRTNSLKNGNFENSHRTNSLQSSRLSNGFTGYTDRTNSLRNRNNFQNGNNNNPIIIHTTKTEDEFGRTKSITTETIQKFGSFEIVRKEIQEITQPRPQFIQKFGNNNGNVGSNGIGVGGVNSISGLIPGYADSVTSNTELASIQEADEEEDNYFATFSGNGISDQPQSQSQSSQSPQSPIQIKSILKDNKSIDDNSVYSDALDMLPTEKELRFKPIPTKQPLDQDQDQYQYNNDQYNDQEYQYQEKPKKLTDEEMYQLALQVAHNKVYGDTNPSLTPNQNQKESFKNHSLRDTPAPRKRKFSLKKIFQIFSAKK